MPREIVCPRCNGTGKTDAMPVYICYTCDGYGSIVVSRPEAPYPGSLEYHKRRTTIQFGTPTSLYTIDGLPRR